MVKLSEHSFKINSIFFSLLWILYGFASVFLSSGVCCSGEGIGLLLAPLYSLFYLIVCISVLVNIKKSNINFYPNIFLFRILLPQILFVNSLPINDATIFAVWADNNLFYYWFLFSISIVSFFIYIAGIVALVRNLSINIAAAEDRQKTKKPIDKLISFLPAILAIFVLIAFNYTQNNLPSHCFLKIDMSKRASCYVKEGITQKDISVCEKIEYLYYNFYKINCYAGIAQATKDETICGKIEDTYSSDICYTDLSVLKQDWSICDKIKETLFDPDMKDSCYKNVGITKHDPSICEKIENIDIQNNCYEKITTR